MVETLIQANGPSGVQIGISLGISSSGTTGTPSVPASVTGVMPTPADASGMTREELAKSNKNAAKVITAWLKANGYSRWCCKYVDWADPSRVKGSVWGNNICDVYTKLKLTNGQWANLFMLGLDNFAADAVPTTADKLKVCIADADGSNPRLREGDEPMTLERVFKNVGQYFSHKVERNTNLSSGDREPVLFSAMAIFVQLGEGEEVQYATFVENYQSTATEANNAIFHFTPQGATLEMDNAPKGEAKMLLTEAVNKDGKTEQFFTKMSASKRKLSEIGTSTMEERVAEAAENKGCEVPLGANHPSMKHGQGYMTVIKPIKSQRCMPSYLSPEAMIAGAMVQNAALPMQSGDMDDNASAAFRSLGDTATPIYNGPGVYRSMNAASSNNTAFRSTGSETVAKQGRCYRGDYAYDAPELATKTPEATTSKGVAIATHVHLVACPPNTPPTPADLKEVMEGLILHELNLLGELKNRHSDPAFEAIGATTESLSVEGAMGIAATLKARNAPVTGVPLM
jgi:hypothetical protein